MTLFLDDRRQTHVNRGVAGARVCRRWSSGANASARGIEAWYTLDGARGEITETNEKGDEYKLCVAGRAAARQDAGRCHGGRRKHGGYMAAGAKDNYLAEFGAQLFTPNFSHLSVYLFLDD